MQVTIEEVGPLTRKLKVEVGSDQVRKEVEAAYRDLASRVSIKGFRKGKVPRKVLEKSYGPKLDSEVGEKLIKETYFDALEESKLEAVVHPEITDHRFTPEGSFVYEAAVDIKPRFELRDYKGIEVEQPEITVTDEEVDLEIEALRRQVAPLRSIEEQRPVQLGDVAIIDFQGYHEGEPMREVVGEKYSVDVGSGRNGKEFEENLLGLAKGDESSREVTFPASFPNPVLAGKKVEFKIKVQDVQERVLPALDDEFVKDVGVEAQNMAELREHIRNQKKEQREQGQIGELSDKLMAKLLEKHDFPVPERLVTYEVNEILKEMENNLERQGLTFEAAGMNREELKKQYREIAEKRVRGDFILKKIAEQESIKVGEEDMKRGFARIASRYGMPLEEVKKYFKNRDDLLPFMNELLNENILKFLRDEAKIKAVAVANPEEKEQ
jgi:trigger factor